MNLWIKKPFVATIPIIATNYWFQYKRRQSTQTTATNVYSRQPLLLRSAHLTDSSKTVLKEKPFSNKWFEPFVTIKPSYRMSDKNDMNPDSSLNWCSGFIFNSRGFVCTTFEPMFYYTHVSIRLGNGQEVKAEIVDRYYEISIYKISGVSTDWPFIEMGDPSTLKVDDPVFAVGFSKSGLYNQLMDGVVVCPEVDGEKVGLHTDDANYTLIQHSIDFHKNNIGSALVNAGGQVIGVNFKHHLGNTFALSVNYPLIKLILKLVDHYLRQYLSAENQSLGLIVKWLDNALLEELKTFPNYNEMKLPTDTKGIIIWWMSDEFKNNCSKGILKQYNVITRINDKDVDSMDQLYKAFEGLKCGNDLQLEVSEGLKIRIKKGQAFGGEDDDEDDSIGEVSDDESDSDSDSDATDSDDEDSDGVNDNEESGSDSSDEEDDEEEEGRKITYFV